MTKLSLYSDGGSRGNPGPAAFGYILKNNKNVVLKKEGKYLGELTNNQAEYQGLIAGLKAALEFSAKGGSASGGNPDQLNCFLDSELIVGQMEGDFKVKNEGLKPLFREAQELAQKFSRITFNHIERSKNSEADKLLNRTLNLHV
ncbi:ribonuclease HI family protein [Patescibacteria group bacterium]